MFARELSINKHAILAIKFKRKQSAIFIISKKLFLLSIHNSNHFKDAKVAIGSSTLIEFRNIGRYVWVKNNIKKIIFLSSNSLKNRLNNKQKTFIIKLKVKASKLKITLKKAPAIKLAIKQPIQREKYMSNLIGFLRLCSIRN